MDYRSIIALSIENKQKSLKEVKKGSSTASTSSNQKGPSNDAIKRFLEKKKKEEVEWLNKLRVKVNKTPPAAKKQKEKSNKTADVKSDSSKLKATVQSDVKSESSKLKSTVQCDVRGHPKKLSNDGSDMKKKSTKMSTNEKYSATNVNSASNPSEIRHKKMKISISSEKSVENKRMKKEETASKKSYTCSEEKSNHKPKNHKEPKSSFVPSFSNYAKILEMANRNSEKPPTFLADPDRAKKIDDESKNKLIKNDAAFERQMDMPTVKKRKSAETNNYQKDDSAPIVKKKRLEDDAAKKKRPEEAAVQKPPIANKYMDKVYTKSPKSSLNSSSKASVNSLKPSHSTHAPSAPVRRGIAAQLSKNALQSQVDSRPSSASAMMKKPEKPLHIKQDVSSNMKHAPENHKSKSESSLASSSKKGIASQNKPLPKSVNTKSTKAAEPTKKSAPKNGVMSITMEDDDSDFLHISRKRESKAPPLAAPEHPKRGIAAQVGGEPPRRGIAAQMGASGAPIRRGIAAQNATTSYLKSRPFRPCIDTDEEDDYEDDYDEDDDFIDDSELVTDTQYKSCVKEIHRSLRFDPTKYESVKPWDDLRSMESNYKEIEKEEKRSYRLGMKEDLADIKAEEERLKKKKEKKKR